MTTALQNAIIESAKSYDATEYSLFEAEMGWEDWMEEFCAEEERVDGAELSETSSKKINTFLRECFEEAHQDEE